MVGTPIQFVWGIITIIAVLLILSISIIASILLHSRRIKESERRFRLLFDRVFDLLILMDSSSKIIDANGSACRRLGFASKGLQGTLLKSLQPDSEANRLMDSIGLLSQQESEFIGETVLLDNSGGRLDVEGALVAFEYANEKLIIASFRDITERKLADEALRKERQSLADKNIALREVLQHIEEEKTGIKKSVSEKIEQAILPVLKKLMISKDSVREVYYNMLVEELNRLTFAGGGLPSLAYKLSPREIEICKLLIGGASTKEIAEALHISVATVNKHRERIRSRLDIANKDINLTSYLQGLSNKSA
jgi:PAS domain S-box-containing protein